MFSLESHGLLLAFGARYSEAEPVLREALAQAKSLGARRYQVILLTVLAETLFSTGCAAEAHERNEEGFVLAHETDMRFGGPFIYALKARMQDDPGERERARAEAEAFLAEGAVGHSPIGYHRIGIDDTLARGEWERMRAHAAALDAYTRDEPLPYTDFLTARGRVLATLGENPGDVAAQAELARLKAEALRLKWPIAWPEFAPG